MQMLAPFLLLLAASAPALAIDEKDLLPVDEAFALDARATERGRIELHWKISRDLIILQQHGTVRIAFSVMADGSVADAKILRPSDVPPYTHAAFQAILESDPFRPLPKDLLRLVPGKDRERVVIQFIYFPSPEELNGRREGEGP